MEREQEKVKLITVIRKDLPITSLGGLRKIRNIQQEEQQCKRLGLQFIDTVGYDGISFINKNKREYKGVYTCNSDSLTISNLYKKEHVNVYIAANIVDGNEHWLFIPSYEIEDLHYNKISNEFILSKNRNILYGKKLVGNYSGGKMMIPKNYLSSNYNTFMKQYAKAREFSLGEMLELNEEVCESRIKNLMVSRIENIGCNYIDYVQN